MSISTNGQYSFLPKLAQYLEDEITKVSSKIVDNHLEQIKQDIEKERVKILAAAGLNVAKNTRFEYVADELHIVIRDMREDSHS